jgi:hypothetical protein
MALEQAN